MMPFEATCIDEVARVVGLLSWLLRSVWPARGGGGGLCCVRVVFVLLRRY